MTLRRPPQGLQHVVCEHAAQQVGPRKVTTGALVNQPPDHFPYCVPGGANAPTYKSGCENVPPPQPNAQRIEMIDRGLGVWGRDSKGCEAKRALGCVAHFGTMADYCKKEFEDAPTYVEGRMGVCCNTNQQEPEPSLE